MARPLRAFVLNCCQPTAWKTAPVLLIAGIVLALNCPQAHAQLRIANWNVYNNPDNTTEDNLMRTVLQGIATQSVNGIATPIDVITLHEIDTTGVSRIPNLLNQVNPGANYQIAYTASVGGDKNAIAYNANTVQLTGTGMTTLDNPSGPRDILRGQFRPVGYSSSDADFYVYSMHLKSSTSYSGTRAAETAYVRADADALGSVNAIYAGDFNFYSTSEAGYQNIRSAGEGQGFDPALDLGFRMTGTSDTSYSSGRRFDFQFVTGELADSEGLDMIPGSYRVYPSSFSGSLSDHRPIVADYQLPAVMDAEIAADDLVFDLNESGELTLSVENIADVLAAVGADELDYTVSVTGDLSGSFADTALALDGANLHSILLDTSTPGVKFGTVLVNTTSQAAENAAFTFPISYTVLPEPGTLSLLVLVGAVLIRRR